jgi:predicted TPR repeat methyltransferase
MPSVSASSADAYNSFAEAYSAQSETSLFNGYYTLPAVVDLAGEVAGRRILDAGCGSGPIAAALRDRGATATGFDSSAGMLELARRRLGPDADLHLADLSGPLHAMTDAFTEAGFKIAVIGEPPPAPDTPREVFAKHFPDAPRPFPFLCFIFFVLDAV